MKATIDGIQVEGTVEEINEFKKLRDAINHDKLLKSLEMASKRIHPNIIDDSGSDSIIIPNHPKIYRSTNDKPFDVKFEDIKCETK